MSAVYPVPENFARKSYIDNDAYLEMYQRSVTDPDGFWAEQAEAFIDWYGKWDKVSEWDFQSGKVAWFMGATLNAGVGMGAYVLTDRATWITFKNKRDFKIAVEGDKNLFNQYGVILVNKANCPSVKADLGQKFIAWLLSTKGQDAIRGYKVNGKQLFIPNALPEK